MCNKKCKNVYGGIGVTDKIKLQTIVFLLDVNCGTKTLHTEVL
jgi:hypothetical protein